MQIYEILNNFIKGLSQSNCHSLLCVGKAGTGKTEGVIKSLHRLGYQQNIHYLYLANYISPLEMYKSLQEVNNLKSPKIIILDDVEVILNDKRIIGLLKSALWDANGKREVYWMSGTHRIKEKHFTFEGKIIFLLNEFNLKNPLLFALKDRSFFLDFKISNQEMFDLMRERAKKDFKHIAYEQKIKIIDYIKDIGENSPFISLRIFQNAVNLYSVSPNNWQPLVRQLVVVDNSLTIN